MSDKQQVKILVAAEAGVGKTTIANQITNVLRLLGFDVDLVDDEPRQPIEKVSATIAKMVCNSNIHIVVETRMLRRSQSENGVYCNNSKCSCQAKPVNAIGKVDESGMERGIH